jgi:hypothetical protein
VVRKILRSDDTSAALLLRDMVYDEEGNVRPARLSALLNAALGYVSDRAEGFIDFDAVPDEGASVQEVLAYLLSPEAKDLRPLLVTWIANGLDLFARDRARKAYARLATLAPRLPFLGPLPMPPKPPVFVPGKGFVEPDALIELLAPALDAQEGIYLQSLTELTEALLGVDKGELEAPSWATASRLLLSPSEQARELQRALGVLAGREANGAVVGAIAAEVVNQLMERQAERAAVPADRLFPRGVRRALQAAMAAGGGGAKAVAAGEPAAQPAPKPAPRPPAGRPEPQMVKLRPAAA